MDAAITERISVGPEAEHVAALPQTECGTLSSTRASIQTRESNIKSKATAAAHQRFQHQNSKCMPRPSPEVETGQELLLQKFNSHSPPSAFHIAIASSYWNMRIANVCPMAAPSIQIMAGRR